MDSAAPIRCQQRLAATIASLVVGPLFMFGPAALGILLVVYRPSLPAAAGCLIMILGSGFIIYHMTQNYHWVELDGSKVRGVKFWSRRFVEHDLADLTGFFVAGSLVKSLETVALDAVLGQVRGYELRFRTGPSIYLVRFDMTNVEPFVRVLIERLAAEPNTYLRG